MKRYLLFDSGCMKCTKIAEKVKEATQGWLEIRSLNDLSIRDYLNSNHPNWSWQPMLLLQDTKGQQRVLTGLSMKLFFTRKLGLYKAFKVVRLIAQFEIASPSSGSHINRQRRAFLQLAYALCLVLLYGCVEVGEVVPVAETEPTPVATLTVTTPTLPPTPISTLVSTTIPSPTPTGQPGATLTLPEATNEVDVQETGETFDVCVDTTLTFVNSERGNIRWRVDDRERLYCCEGVGSPYQINQNPDPASHLVLVSVRINSNLPTQSANVVVNLATGDFKILGNNYIDDPRYVLAWLPDGQMVWADDQGEVFLGSLTTEESLNAPTPMTDLWFVAPDRILTRDETFQFWYFDLTDAIWTQLPESESKKITTRWVDHAAVSDDSRYVFFHFESYVAILLNDTGTFQIISPAEYYAIFDPGQGDTLSPPQQILGTPYWFFQPNSVFREFSQVEYMTRGFIVDSITGEVIGHDILGIPPELAIYASYLSPDRTWVAVEVVEAIGTLGQSPAQVRVSQTWFISLSTGDMRVEDGEFAGWEADNQAYLNAPLSCTQQQITIDLAPSIEA